MVESQRTDKGPIRLRILPVCLRFVKEVSRFMKSEHQLQFQLEDLNVSRNYRKKPWRMLSLNCCNLYGTIIKNHNLVIK